MSAGSRPPNQGGDRRNHRVRLLFQSQAALLGRYFERRTSSKDEAADLVQESFLRILRRPDREEIVNPAAFLQRIARNLLIDRARANAAKPTLLDVETEELPTEPEQSRAIDAADLKSAYLRAVTCLPPRTREVFLLHRQDELTYAEIAGRLGISVRTVEWHIAEALLRIRRGLDDR